MMSDLFVSLAITARADARMCVAALLTRSAWGIWVLGSAARSFWMSIMKRAVALPVVALVGVMGVSVVILDWGGRWKGKVWWLQVTVTLTLVAVSEWFTVLICEDL